MALNRSRLSPFPSLSSLPSAPVAQSHIDQLLFSVPIMTPFVRTDTPKYLATAGDDRSRHGSVHSQPVFVHASRSGPRSSTFGTIEKSSPPPISRRLRSHAGRVFNTNMTLPWQHMNHSSDGTHQFVDDPVKPLGYDGESNAERLAPSRSSSAELEEVTRHNKPFADFFDPEVIRRVFSDSTTRQRLHQFAKSRKYGAKIDFLFKVCESYTRGRISS